MNFHLAKAPRQRKPAGLFAVATVAIVSVFAALLAVHFGAPTR